MGHTFSAQTNKWFIVYPSNDKEEVEKRLIDVLRLNNITCVYEGHDFDSNSSVNVIKRKINSCQKIIVILTKNSQAKKTNAVFKALQKSNRIKEVVFIWFNLDCEEEAKKLKQEYTLYGDNRMLQLTPDFNWLDIEETSSVFVGQVWSHFNGYTKIVLPHLEDRIKESEWYQNDPGRFPLKEFNIIPQSAKTATLKEFDKDIKEEGELQHIECDRGSYSKRQYKVKVYSITKNNEKYYFVGLIPNTIGILRTLEQGTSKVEEKIFPRISAEERLRQVDKFAALLEHLINHPDNSGCNNRAKVFKIDDEVRFGDDLWVAIEQTLKEESDDLKPNIPKAALEKVDATGVYQGLAWAYVIDYLSITLDKHVQTLKELKKFYPQYNLFEKLIIVVPSSVASKRLEVLDRNSDGGISDTFQQCDLRLQQINDRCYQLIIYKLRKAEKTCIVAAEHPNPILCLQEMTELKRISGSFTFSTEAHRFYKLTKKLIECSPLAGQAHVLYYDDLGGKQIDEAVYEVVKETITGLTQNTLGYPDPTEYTQDATQYKKGDLVQFKRLNGMFFHWGVYDKDDYIYHLTPKHPEPVQEHQTFLKFMGKGKVAYDKIKDVARNSETKRNNTMDRVYIPSHPDTIIERAKSLKNGQNVKYSIQTSNCEHFATYCRYGASWSQQVCV